MWFVKFRIPGDKFFDAMYDMSGWLADACIETANFTYSRDAAGDIRLRVSFLAAGEARRFAERFDGYLLPPEAANAAAKAEPLRLDAERRIELAAEILEGDRSGQRDELSLAVMPSQPPEQRVVDPLAGDRHALGVFERRRSASENSWLSRQPVTGQFRLASIAFPHTEGVDVKSRTGSR